jgi:hypothetical protein
MLVLPNSIAILPKGDVKSDVEQWWQGLAGSGKRGSRRRWRLRHPSV